jgi:hypothetical protein
LLAAIFVVRAVVAARSMPEHMNVCCAASRYRQTPDPVLADILRWEGLTVTEAHDIDTVRPVALTAFDIGVEVNQAAETKKHARKDIAGHVVDKVIAKSEIKRAR